MTDDQNDNKIQEEEVDKNPQVVGESITATEDQTPSAHKLQDDDPQPETSQEPEVEKAQDEIKSAEKPAPENVEAKVNEVKSANGKPAESAKEKSGEPEETATPDEKPAPAKSKIPGANWYVVHTYSGHESKVATTLKQRVDSQKLSDKVLDILVPTQEKIEIKEGKKNTIKEKIFPGYLLVHMVLDDTTWLAVRTTPGITGFIGTANKPTPLPEDEVETIKRFMSMEAPKFKAAFRVSEAVKITDGPFSEFLGSISEIDEEKGKLKVLVSIFGRETPVELDFLQVAKL